MFIATSVYDYRLDYIDLEDREFFIECLENAKNGELVSTLSSIDKDEIKKKYSPVLFFSKLSKQTKSETVINRSMFDWDRARRRFIMLDLDFDEGEEDLSKQTYDELINFAELLKTPIMIYPSTSFPEKPRYRVVFLTQRLLNQSSYYQAVNYIYSNLSIDKMDKLDTNIKMNRNLPIFRNLEQIEAIYSTFDDEKLKPLNNNLWKHLPKPRKKRIYNYYVDNDQSYDKLELDDLIKAVNLMKNTDFLLSYETVWMLISSLSKAVIQNQILVDDVYVLLKEIAGVTNNLNLRRSWEEGNIDLFNTLHQRNLSDMDNLKNIRPLETYFEVKGVLSGRY